mmetsp:Transcript_105889/g.187224  ORF Transcript_105889/g.187224 Transcript_105889/m.187224 type:complete len:827 (-) Transcript_105889:225-2705(-)
MSLTAWRTAHAALGRIAVRQAEQTCKWSPFGSVGNRATSSSSRKRRRTYHRALNDPDAHPGTLKKLREGAASPSHSLLRYLAENKVHKAVTQADRRNLWFTLQFKKYAPVFVGQVKPRMQFWTAALDESQLPLPRLPEVAIAGRSNTGKSTLVNYLCGRHSAKVTRMPGSTRELVFWRIGRPAQLCVVDLPGYGFAHAPQETRLAWTEFSLWYLRSRKNLARVLMLVDARQGLKPSDREMIAYLERHGVSWQVIVTKCDTVKGKDLARRLTVLQEDLAGFHKMVQAPIPISALKRKGMEKLRDVLDRLKVQKEVVKDGIKRRVYDLLEQKRIQRAETARARRERRKQQQDEQKAQEAVMQDVSNTDADAGDGTPLQGGPPDLHTVLDDSLHPAPGSVRAHGDPEREGDRASHVSPKQPEVAEARYSLEDRDSRRIDSLMSNLFPDLPDMTLPEKGVRADAPWLIASQPGELTSAHTWKSEAVFEGPGDLRDGRAHLEDDSGSDSDWEEPVTMPPVLRFDPAPGAHAFQEGFGLGGAAMSSSALPAAVAFGAAEGLGSFPSLGADRRLHPSRQVGLRPGWERPPSNQDRMYDEDDFATPEEQASGTRRWSPPAPTAATRGQLMAEARKRYEREWATELESVDNARSAVADAGGGERGRLTSRDAATAGLAAASKSGPAVRGAPSSTLPAPPRPTYIMKGGRKPVPKRMRAQWRNFGRPPAVILKKKQQPDIAEKFGLKQRQRKGRKRNFGDGLDWSEAKGKWINWFKASKRRNIRRVLQASSPKQEDVQAEFEERKQLWRRRSGSSGRQHAQRTSARFGSAGDQADE